MLSSETDKGVKQCQERKTNNLLLRINLERATKELFQPFEKYYTLKKFETDLKDYRNQIKFLYSKIFDKRAEEVRLERTEDLSLIHI